MNKEGFKDNEVVVETPNGNNISEKPLKSKIINPNRVDINVLKSKLQESESREFKKCLYTFFISFRVRHFRHLPFFVSICK